LLAEQHPATFVWLRDAGHGLDGIVAKRLDLPYQPGRRAMQKYKVWKTVGCVVGGVWAIRSTGWPTSA
jgi:ATP-dependent DNA ligase